MGALVIDGRAISATLRNEVSQRVVERLQRGRRPPGLAVILVGDDPASAVYVRSKAKQCKEVGMRSFEFRLPGTSKQTELLALIARLNDDDNVHGILVQLPLPLSIDSHAIISAINPGKDVDGFHPINVGRLSLGLPGFAPCTPLGCMRLLEAFTDNLRGLSAVVIGRSNIVGKPLAQMLLARDCTVTAAHSKTVDLPEICRRADILIAAVGKPAFVKGSWLKPGGIVLDVGINRISVTDGEGQNRLVGDVDFGEACDVAGAITPVPGGVGPMTIACLLSNTLEAAERREECGH